MKVWVAHVGFGADVFVAGVWNNPQDAMDCLGPLDRWTYDEFFTEWANDKVGDASIHITEFPVR